MPTDAPYQSIRDPADERDQGIEIDTFEVLFAFGFTEKEPFHLTFLLRVQKRTVDTLGKPRSLRNSVIYPIPDFFRHLEINMIGAHLDGGVPLFEICLQCSQLNGRAAIQGPRGRYQDYFMWFLF